LATQ